MWPWRRNPMATTTQWNVSKKWNFSADLPLQWEVRGREKRFKSLFVGLSWKEKGCSLWVASYQSSITCRDILVLRGCELNQIIENWWYIAHLWLQPVGGHWQATITNHLLHTVIFSSSVAVNLFLHTHCDLLELIMNAIFWMSSCSWARKCTTKH